MVVICHPILKVVGPLKLLVQSLWKKLSGELMPFAFRYFSFWWTCEGVFFQYPLATEIFLCEYSYLNERCVGMTDLKAASHQNCLFKEMSIWCNVRLKKILVHYRKHTFVKHDKIELPSCHYQFC